MIVLPRVHSAAPCHSVPCDALLFLFCSHCSDFPHMKCITIKLYKDAGAPSPRQRSKSGQVHQAVYMGKVDVLTVEQVDGIEKESW